MKIWYENKRVHIDTSQDDRKISFLGKWSSEMLANKVITPAILWEMRYWWESSEKTEFKFVDDHGRWKSLKFCRFFISTPSEHLGRKYLSLLSGRLTAPSEVYQSLSIMINRVG